MPQFFDCKVFEVSAQLGGEKDIVSKYAVNTFKWHTGNGLTPVVGDKCFVDENCELIWTTNGLYARTENGHLIKVDEQGIVTELTEAVNY